MNSIKVLDQPFRHVVLQDFFPKETADAALEWLEGDELWGIRSVQDFYETYDLDLRQQALPRRLDFLASVGFCKDIRHRMERIFQVELASHVDATAQKMCVGQRIGVHTDFGPVGQSHRLLIQLNRGWSIANGGLLMMFHEEFPTEISSNHQYYLPLHGTAYAFEISPHSFHAVSRVASGTRYTLCYSFRRRGEG